jgi:hypothetical protein
MADLGSRKYLRGQQAMHGIEMGAMHGNRESNHLLLHAHDHHGGGGLDAGEGCTHALPTCLYVGTSSGIPLSSDSTSSRRCLPTWVERSAWVTCIGSRAHRTVRR